MDAQRASTALRTISMRLRGVSSDGQTLTELTPKLQKYFDAYGTNVKLVDEATGAFNSTYDILNKLSDTWSTLTDKQRAHLTELIAGKRNSDTLNAVLGNQKTLVDALTTSQTSFGSAMAENDVVMESITKKVDLFSKAVDDLFQHTLSSDSIKSLVEFGTVLIKITDNLGLLNVILGIATAAFILKKTQIFELIAAKVGYITTTAAATAATIAETAVTIAETAVTTASTAATTADTVATVVNTAAKKAAAVAMTGLVALIATGLVIGIGLLIKRQQELKASYDELASAATTAVDAFKKNSDEFDRLYVSLQKATQGTDEYYQITAQLGNILPQIIDYVDEEGNIHLVAKDAVDEHISSLEELNNLYKNSAKANYEDENALLDTLSDKKIALATEISEYKRKQIKVGTGSVKDILSAVFQPKQYVNQEVELSPELTFQKAFLDFETEQAYETIKNSLASQVVQGTDVDDEFTGALNNYLSNAIQNMDVNSSDNIEIVGGKMLALAETFTEVLANQDTNGISKNILGIIGGDDSSFGTVFEIRQNQIYAIMEAYNLTYDAVIALEYAFKAEAEAAQITTEANQALILTIEELGNNYVESVDSLDAVLTMQNKINNAEELTHQLRSEILEQFPDLTDELTDYASAQTLISDKVTQAETEVGISYARMNKGSAQFWKDALNRGLITTVELMGLANQASSNFADNEAGRAAAAVAAAQTAASAWSQYFKMTAQQLKSERATLLDYSLSSGDRGAYDPKIDQIDALLDLYSGYGSGSIAGITPSGGGGGGGGSSSATQKLQTYIDLLKEQLAIEKDLYENQVDLLEVQLDNLEALYDQQDALLELEERRLEVAKAQEGLANALNERDVLQYTGEGTTGWEWIANPDAVREAQEELADATSALQETELEMARDAEKQFIQSQIDNYEAHIDALQEFISDMGLINDDLADRVTSWLQLLSTMSAANISTSAFTPDYISGDTIAPIVTSPSGISSFGLGGTTGGINPTGADSNLGIPSFAPNGAGVPGATGSSTTIYINEVVLQGVNSPNDFVEQLLNFNQTS